MLGSAKEISVSISPSKRSRSLAPYVFDVVSVGLLLALMAVLFYFYRVQKDEQDLNKSSTTVLAQATVIVRNELDSVATDALLLANDVALPGMENRFKALMQLRPNYRYASITDRHGRTLSKVRRKGAGLTAIDAEGLRSEPVMSLEQRGFAAAPGSLYAAAPSIELDEKGGNQRVVIAFAAPLFGEYLAREGAVIIGYDLDGLLTTVRAISPMRSGHFDLVDAAGKPIDGIQHSHVRSPYSWMVDIPVTSSGAPHEGKLRLQYEIDQHAIALERRIQALWAGVFWLFALVPIASLFCFARGARAGDREAKLALAQNEERLLEAERLARIGYWRWQSERSLLMLSPQAATMLGCPSGEQHVDIQDVSALHSLEDEIRFMDRVRHVINTGETSSADLRVATLRGDRWLHSIMRPARDEKGIVVGVFGTLQDISARKKMEEELRALKADYAALLDHLPAGVIYMDADGRLSMVNEGFLTLTGITREKYEGRHYLDVIQHPEAQRLLQENIEIMRSETPRLGIVLSVPLNNEARWFRLDKLPRRDTKGKVIGLVIFLVDITALKRAEQQLHALTAEREIMLNRIPASVIYKSATGKIIRVNRMAASIAGMSPEAMEGRTLDEIYPLGDHEVTHRIDDEVIRTAQPKLGLVVQGRMNDGATHWFEMDTFPTFDDSGHVNGIVLFGVDVTQRKQAEEQIAYLAMHDPLTDLCNRRLLSDRLVQALAQCARRHRRCALLFIDLDHFKHVNDLHGHEIGDLLLIQAAQRLCSCVRAEDTVCRIGGDEFVILLSDTNSISDAMVVANKVQSAFSQRFALRGVSTTIGCSIGVASFPEHGRTEQELMCAADAAMYAAKESGRNAVRVSSSCVTPPPRHDAA